MPKTYTVKRAYSQNGRYNVIASGLVVKEFVDQTARNKRTYFYVVMAAESDRESMNSEQVQATPRR
ncbi:MAG: hypothetical protein ACRD9R_03945 [Pyrinomonadaceae bacterium]